MTDQTPTLAPENEELIRLATERDSLRKQRDELLDRNSPAWVELNEKFQRARRDWERVYSRIAKRQQRQRDAEQAAVAAVTQEKDPFTLWFANLSPKDRREFCLTHPGFLRIDFPIQLDRMRATAGVAMLKDIVTKFGLSEIEAAQEMESILKSDLLKIYGLYESELNAILDGSYKVQWQLDPPTQLYDCPAWHAAPRLALPAPPVTNAQAAAHQENVTLRAEVHQVLTETPLQRFDRERDERVAEYQARVAQLRGQQ